MLESTLARVLALLAAVAAVLGVGAYLASRHYEPIVAGLDQKLGASAQTIKDDQAAYGVLAAQAKTQNDAILGLQRAAEARAASAATAIAAAETVAAKSRARANVLLASKPAPGVNICDAARALVDAQIKQERP
ncbi:hypothetical protein WI36_24345 [Burkholderia ubonensis]|uniref:hypothetical protein n=1 Tax=Burkholderia ubonensis TaxID=101571 RepID=UPI000756C7F4|nr:hypothetical protein [Burkholderia ubonensis]KUZ66898.1 hypothetical protein WI36_24345 [Burkholderia ubonensis]